MSNEELIKQLTFSLVTLSIKANNVVMKGNFPGEVADEVYSLLKLCQEVHDEFVEPE